jgi:hypothetical protein
MWGGRYRGQRQKWFVMRFTGIDEDINLATEHPEFDAWQWVAPGRLPADRPVQAPAVHRHSRGIPRALGNELRRQNLVCLRRSGAPGLQRSALSFVLTMDESFASGLRIQPESANIINVLLAEP